MAKEIRTVVSSRDGWADGEGTSGSDGKVLHLDREIGYTGICICQNSLNCSLRRCEAHCM